MRDVTKTILRFAKPHKWRFAILFFCILITSFSSAFYPYIFGKLVDEVFYGKNKEAFITIVLVYAGVYFGNAFLHFILNMSWASLMTRFLFDLREACFYKALKLKPEFLANSSAGDLTERTNNDVEDFMDLIHWNIFYTTATVISLIVTLAIVWRLNRWFFVIMLLLIPITAVLSKRYRDQTHAVYSDAAGRNGLITGWIYEIVKGVTEIQLLAAEKRVRNSFNRQNTEVVRRYIAAALTAVKSQCVTNGLSAVSRIVLFVMAAFFVYRGELTIGAFIAGLDYFNNGVNYFKSLNSKGIGIQKNLAKIKRVVEHLEREEEQYHGTELLDQDGGIVFDNVSFSYENGHRVLDGVSFAVKDGETISLAGKSGAGKSTIAGLTLRMYDPESGSISAFGQNIADCSIQSVRKQFGLVLQEVILFDGTVRENLLMAKPDATDDEIWTALQNANLDSFIGILDRKLDTVLGQGGVQFSGGQRQRLSIARIFLKNPKVIILDEATSSLDAETEAQVQAAWQKLRANRTTIIIAHRYSTIRNSDRVLVIEDGRVAAYDSHERLTGKNPAYDRLFLEQIQEETIC